MELVGLSIGVGALALLMGLLLLFAPGVLRKLNELSARLITRIDSMTFSYRVGVGTSLLIIAAFMFFMAYYFKRRYY